MSDCFKCSIISLGIGMAAGIYVATNNKKIQKFVKDTEALIVEKLDSVKQGTAKFKEEYMGDDEENLEEVNDEIQNKKSNKLNKKKK